MYEEITQIVGKEDGPISIILAGVHGNETCGVEALKKILPTLQIEKGTVLFGFGNPRAIVQNVRITETNLNRMFKKEEMLSEKDRTSYEYTRAQFLKKYLEKADAMLDIHASSNTKSKPFVICEPNSKGITEYLPVDLIVSGFDEVEPGGTDYYMNSIGKIGICVECGVIGDPMSTTIAEQSIFAFLKSRGHIPNDQQKKNQSHIHMYDLYMTKTEKFTIAKEFSDFEELSSGQVIGTDGVETIKADRDCIILFPHSRNKIGDEGFLLGEKKNSLV